MCMKCQQVTLRLLQQQGIQLELLQQSWKQISTTAMLEGDMTSVAFATAIPSADEQAAHAAIVRGFKAWRTWATEYMRKQQDAQGPVLISQSELLQLQENLKKLKSLPGVETMLARIAELWSREHRLDVKLQEKNCSSGSGAETKPGLHLRGSVFA